MTDAQQTSQKQRRPQLRTSSLSFNNIYPQSSKNQQIIQSPLSYDDQEKNDILNRNPLPNNINKSKSNTFSSLFSNSRSSTFFKRRRSETYQEDDEFTSGCCGFLNTFGSKMKYKVNNTWIRIKVKCKPKEKDSNQVEWKSKAKTLNQL